MEPLFRRLHVYEEREAHSAAMNMAIDEALLEQSPSPVLRFYGWRRPSVSFGYFGNHSDVAEHEQKRELVRRWTGGGIVLHGEDFTYSIIVRTHDAAPPLPAARALYPQVHEAVRRTLGTGAEITLAAEATPKISDACYANPVFADALWRGQKIAGAAQRRTRGGLLHQGSIQHPNLPADFANKFATELSRAPEKRPLPGEVLRRAETLVRELYGTEAWLRRR